MTKSAFSILIAALLPVITITVILAPAQHELIIILIVTVATLILAWLLNRHSDTHSPSQDNVINIIRNPRARIKSLLAPTHDLLEQLRSSEQDNPAVIKKTRLIATEVDALNQKLGWYQRKRDQYVATILVSDLRGFTTISETYDADEIVNMLNRYFEEMSNIIYKYEGSIDKLMGDSILAEFSCHQNPEQDAINAVSCAAEMQIAMYRFNRESQRLSMPSLYMGIGLNTGEIVSSRLGSQFYNEHTIIGNEVNLAARIESSTVRGQILISDSTYQHTQGSIEASEPMKILVKGKHEAVPMYELQSVTRPAYLKVPEREIRRSPRVDVDIPFRFHVCEGKIITSDENHGHISNISTGGMLVFTEVEVEPYFFIRFRLDFNVLGIECNDIYGKVIRVIKKEQGYELNIEFTVIDARDRHSIQDLVNSSLAGKQHQWQQIAS